MSVNVTKIPEEHHSGNQILLGNSRKEGEGMLQEY